MQMMQEEQLSGKEMYAAICFLEKEMREMRENNILWGVEVKQQIYDLQNEKKRYEIFG